MNPLFFLVFCAISCQLDIPLVTERFIISRNCLLLICDVVGEKSPSEEGKKLPKATSESRAAVSDFPPKCPIAFRAVEEAPKDANVRSARVLHEGKNCIPPSPSLDLPRGHATYVIPCNGGKETAAKPCMP